MKDLKVYQTSGMLNFLVSEASDVRKKEQTLSGDIVSFSADEQSPLKIVVDIDSTGWTGCEVARTGANLFNKATAVQGKWLNINTGAVENTTSTYWLSDYIPVKAGVTYTSAETQSSRNWLYDTNKNALSRVTTRTFTPTQDGFYRTTISISAGVSLDNVQVVVGSTLPTYEAYNGTTLSVTFPVEAGTVTAGTLTIDYDGSVKLQTGGQTYTLTSVSPIETLIGDNNIWADAGPVSVTYPI